MKKILIILIVIFFLLAFVFITRLNEDTWIKNSDGIWVKHGNPSAIPDYVKEQQDLISSEIILYDTEK